jgi:hypothetical protein
MRFYLSILAGMATLALCAALGAVTYAAIEIGRTAKQVGKDEPVLATQYSKIGEHADNALTEYGQVYGRFDHEVTLIQGATNDAKKLFQNTNISLNGGPDILHRGKFIQGALPAATVALSSTANLAGASGRVMDAAGRAIADTSNNLQPSLKEFSVAATSLATQTPIVMQNVVTATQQTAVAATNTAKATDNANATLVDVRTGVHYELHQIMKPVSKIRVAAEEGARIAGKLLGL